MKALRKHIVVAFLLGVALFYSAPIKSLHDCNNLNHFQTELSFDQHHEDCLICEFQFSPFDCINIDYSVACPILTVEHTETPFHFIFSKECLSEFNKGPPAILIA